MTNDQYYYNDEEHKYYINNQLYPSVTDICDPISFKNLDSINKHIVEIARERGHRIHEFCEEYCINGEIDFAEVDDDCLPYMYAFDMWYRTYKPKILYTEKKMFSKELGFCGTCDLICEIDGKTILVDYKSTSVLDKKYLSVQFAGYKRLAKQYDITIDECIPLHLKKNQDYSFTAIDSDEEWFDCLFVHYKKIKKPLRAKKGEKDE